MGFLVFLLFKNCWFAYKVWTYCMFIFWPTPCWYRQFHICGFVSAFTATCTTPNACLTIPKCLNIILQVILILKHDVVAENCLKSQTFLVASLDCCCWLMDGDLPLTTYPLPAQPMRMQILRIRHSDWPSRLFAMTYTRLTIN